MLNLQTHSDARNVTRGEYIIPLVPELEGKNVFGSEQDAERFPREEFVLDRLWKGRKRHLMGELAFAGQWWTNWPLLAFAGLCCWTIQCCLEKHRDFSSGCSDFDVPKMLRIAQHETER